MYNYRAFNLPIQSELKFPELLPLSCPINTDEAITITWGEVSAEGLGAAPTKGLYYQATTTELWLHVPNIARFLIRHGKHIIIDPVSGIDEDSVRLFILGSCMGALLMQRNLLLLHGNAVKIEERCITFVGHSGAGKSTLSGAFFKRGYSILADDICAITPQGDVLPSFPQVKLWFDTAHHLGIDTTTLRKIRPAIEKFAIPLKGQFHQNTLPLKVVYVLNSHNKDDFDFEPINGMHKLLPLQNHTYRKSYLKGLAKDRTHFAQCADLAKQIDLVRITRPHDGFKLDELVELVLQDLQCRGM